MATDKIKRALRPAIPMATPAAYEAAVTGTMSQDREYAYSDKEGFAPTLNEKAKSNVFSTFALNQDNTVTTRELVQDRVKNADLYAKEAQAIARTINSRLPVAFDKSSYLGTIVDVFNWAGEGIADYGADLVRTGRELPNTTRDIKANWRLNELLHDTTEEEKDNVNAALEKAYNIIANTKAPGESASRDVIDYSLAVYNIDSLTGKNGQALTEKEKQVIQAFQGTLLTQAQHERTQMEEAFFQEYEKRRFANTFVNPGMGATSWRTVGNLAGNVLASGYTFRIAGTAPYLAGMTGARRAAGLGRNIIRGGVKNARKVQKARGVMQLAAAKNRQSLIRPETVRKVQALDRYSDYQIGVGKWVTNNFAKVAALGAITGKTAVFSQSFLQAFTDTRNDLLAQGADWQTATSAAIASGFGEASLETLIGFRCLNKFLTQNRSFRNFLFKAVIPEGFEELSQTATTEAIKMATGFSDKQFSDLAAEMLYSFIGGAMGGAMFGAGSYASISQNDRVLATALYARNAALSGRAENSVLQAYGSDQAAIRQKYAQLSDDAAKKLAQERKEVRKSILAAAKGTAGIDPNWIVNAEATFADWDNAAQAKATEEDAARQEQMAAELAKLRQDFNIKIQEQAKEGKQSKESFTQLELDILDKLRAEYDERAKKINPDVTLGQLERGWKGVRDMLLHDGYTGEFTTAVSNAMDNMISFASAADENIRKDLEDLSKTLGLTQEEKDAALKLTSADSLERYNAQLDDMEQRIIRDFSLAGAAAEGKVFANIFRNQLGHLPVFATYLDGSQMTPLDFYNAVKPRIINIQNTLMHNEQVENINNVMMEAAVQSDSEENYLDENGKINYSAAYDKYLNLWNLIESYEMADENAKKQLLANINLTLFNSYNYTDDVKFIKDYINGRAAKEYAIIKDMGLDYGSTVSDEDFRVLALMRQKGLSFAFSARAIGLVASFRGKGRSEDVLNKRYNDKLNELYPPMNDEDRIWLNRIAQMEKVGKTPKYRDYTIDFADNDRTTYKESQQEVLDQSEEQAKADIEEEEGAVLEETVDVEDAMREMEQQKSSGNTLTITKAEQENIAAADERERGQTNKYIAPNALYARKGRTILVVNGENQGEFLHEAGHYMITEFLLNHIELGNIVGDKAFGPVNELLISLYSALKGNKKIRLNPVSKQETLLDALMDFIRTDGHTGNPVADELISQMQIMLNDEVLHIEDSRYNELTAAQKANLRNSIKNLFKPTAGMEMLDSVRALDALINNKPIDEARKAALNILNNYAIPDADNFQYKLSQDNLDYITTRAILEEFRNEVNLQAIARLLNNSDSLEERAARESRSKNEAEDIQEDQVFFMAKAKENAPSPRLAREGISWKEHGAEAYEIGKKIVKDPGKYLKKMSTPLFSSLIDVANAVSPNLGPVIQRSMFEKDQFVKEGQYYGKLFINALEKQNKTASPITQKEYDDNFVDAIDNLRIDEAKEWIVKRAATPEIAADFEQAFNGMISFLNTAKEAMKKQEVKANWMADGAFFPRSIKNYQKFSEEWLRTAPEGVYSRMVKSGLIDEKGAKIKKSEANYAVQRAFAKLIRDGNNAEGRVGFLQNRIITEVTPDMRQYYKDPIDAYMDYVEDAATTILTRKLIGASHTELRIDENGNMNSLLNAGRIADVLTKENLLKKGRIDLSGFDEKQIEEVRQKEAQIQEFNKALSAFINRHREYNGLYKFTNDALTVTMLAHASTALSQGQEMITTAFLFGLNNTASAAYNVARGKTKITIDDLGIDELEDAYKAMTTGTMEKVASGALKYSGFKMADVYFKNVALNAIYNYFENALKDPNSSDFKKAMELVEKSFSGMDDYNNRIATLMDDLQNKRLSDDVKYLMYDVFANQQPINAANISYGYNATSPLGRLCLYKFNTVAYRQAHAIVSRLKSNFTEKGPDGKLKMKWGKGLLEVMRFMFFCGLIGVPLETVKNLLNGRTDFNPKKDYIFSVAQCFLLNEYDAKVLAREGVGSFLQNKAAPPLTPLNWLSQDVRDLFKGDYTAKTFKGLPMVGRPLHNIIYSFAEDNNDGIGFDFNFFNLDEMDDFSWG